MSPEERVDAYRAEDWLDPAPSPGQVLVREIARRASSPEEMCEQIAAEDALARDERTGWPAGASAAWRAYVEAHVALRPASGDRHGPLGYPFAVRRLIPGSWGAGRERDDDDELMPWGRSPDAHVGPLSRFLRPHLRAGLTLWDLFHEGVVPEWGQPHGLLLPAEGFADLWGGSHRLMAHLMAGVLVPPGVGHWTIHPGLDDLSAIEELERLELVLPRDRGFPMPRGLLGTDEERVSARGAWRREIRRLTLDLEEVGDVDEIVAVGRPRGLLARLLGREDRDTGSGGPARAR